MTRMYTYIRIDPDCYLDAEKFILELKDKGFNAKKNRIFIEEVKAKTSIKLRHKFMAILIYALDENDILIVKSLNCLGNSIYEIINIINKLDEMKIKLIILDYLNIGVTVELRKFLKLFFEFQKKIEYQSEVKRSVEKSGTS
ncbi:recombinase family protein [Acinetobacter pittii]|uniref:Recombinase family protein n=1 Tax=Acinetobacter pittii TaxID=48296 RepID=A0AAE8KFM1_ACIPI|nr:recombinase family protein [Acinetobacter pittii]